MHTITSGKTTTRRLFQFGLAAIAMAMGVSGQAQAQAYPNKPIRLIVPFPAGGPTDAMARAVGLQLTKRFGQPVVIDNRGGAGGSIGAEALTHAAPDGYTLMLTTAGVVSVNPSLTKVNFDTMKDMAPVVLTGTIASIMVVPPALGLKTVGDFIKLAKSKPGQLNYGSSGSGSASHLAMEMFDRAADIKVVHVPYKGAAPAVVDLVGGNVQVMLIGSSTVLPMINGQKLTALGVSSPKRSVLTPSVPTIAETIPGFEVINWLGVFAPAKTPPAIVAQLNTAINSFMREKEFQDGLAPDGFDVADPNTPEQFSRYVQAEITRWAKVIKDANITTN